MLGSDFPWIYVVTIKVVDNRPIRGNQENIEGLA